MKKQHLFGRIGNKIRNAERKVAYAIHDTKKEIKETVDAVRESRVPILILHGEDDRFVPCEMSREIAKAAPDKVRLETFPGAGHALSYMVDPERYRRVTAEFLQSCVNAKRS